MYAASGFISAEKHSQQSRKQLSFWKACKRKKIKLDANPVVASDWCLLFCR